MGLSAPKFITWLAALLIGILGILLKLGIVAVSGLTISSFWVVVAGFGLLVLGTIFKGL